MIDAPTSAPLTAGDLDSKTNTGRIYHLLRTALAPAGCDEQGRRNTRPFGASAYGDDMAYPKAMPVVVPCSTLGRWALAWRRFWLG